MPVPVIVHSSCAFTSAGFLMLNKQSISCVSDIHDMRILDLTNAGLLYEPM